MLVLVSDLEAALADAFRAAGFRGSKGALSIVVTPIRWRLWLTSSQR